MDEKYQEMLRTMQMARARPREEGPSQAPAVHQADGAAPQARTLQLVQHHLPSQQQQSQLQTADSALAQTAARPIPAVSQRVEDGGAQALPFELQVMQRMGFRAVVAPNEGLHNAMTPIEAAPHSQSRRQEQATESLQHHRLQRPEGAVAMEPQWHQPPQQQHLHPHAGAATPQLRTMEGQGLVQQLVLDLSRREGDSPMGGAAEEMHPQLQAPLVLDGSAYTQQASSAADSESRRQRLNWQHQQQLQQQHHRLQQRQQQLQLLPLSPQEPERPAPWGGPEQVGGRRQESGVQGASIGPGWLLVELGQQHQQQARMLLQQQHSQGLPPRVQAGGASDIAAAVADMLQSRHDRRQPVEAQVQQQQQQAQHERDLQMQQQQHRLQFQAGTWDQGGGDDDRNDVVDLTGDEEGGEGAGAKRRLPSSFLMGAGAPKRLAPIAAPMQLMSPNGGFGPAAEPPGPAGRRLPASLMPAGAASGGGSSSALSRQQPQQPQPREDPRQPSAREQELRQHLDVINERLRDGTMPVGRGSSELRPMTEEERLRFEEAAPKLQREIEMLQRERQELMLALQQQQQVKQQQVKQQQAQQQAQQAQAQQKNAQQQTWPAGAGPQAQQQARPVHGFPPVTTGMPVGGGKERYRGLPNGVTLPRGALGPTPSIAAGAGAGGSGGGGAAAAAAAAAVAAKGLPSPAGSVRESAQSRVTEHQQALRDVIEGLQVTGNEELEPPPKSLQVTALLHQRIALAWMIRRETGSGPRGGILADDQGLGKTITTISLIVTHTNPEDCGQPRDAQQQQQQQAGQGGQQQQQAAAGGGGGGAAAGGDGGRAGNGVVIEMLEEEGDEDLGAEDEGEEEVDACGVRLGALRAEREAAGAAEAAEAEGAAADMIRDGAGAATSTAAPPVSRLPMPPTAAAAAAAVAPSFQSNVKPEGGFPGESSAAGTGGGPGGPTYVNLLDDDDDDDDSPARSKAGVMARGGAATDDPDILSITEGPSGGRGGGAAGASLNLPPTAAGSLGQLASSNLDASASTNTAALLAAQRQQLPAASGGRRRGAAAAAAHGKPLYEADPPNLLLGGTLVVCPTSVLHQWAREIRDKVSPNAGVVVHMYHGKDRASNARQLAAMGVVLTTYGTLAQEAPSRDKQAVKLGRQGTTNTPINLAADDSGGEEQPQGGAAAAPAAAGGKSGRPRGKAPMDPEGGPLYQIKWRRVVLDEAQSIKNPRTLAAHAAWRLFAHCRWCLSGTPIQNTVDDLYSYFRFLRYAPYCESRKFKELIKGKIAEKPEIGYKFLQAVLQTVLLRRTKQSTINGEPIIKLPAREQQLLKIKFSGAEAAFYGQVQSDSLRAIKEAREGGVSGSRQYVNMLHSLLKLRQACNHPWLVRGARNTWHKTGTPSSSEVEAARKLSLEARSALVAALSRGDAQCPCCGDIAEDPVASSCGHVFCAQCLAAQKEGGSVEGELLCPACSRLLRGADLHSAAALAAVDPAAAAAMGGRAGGGEAPGGSGGGSEWVSSAKVERLLSLLEGIRSKGSEQSAARPGGSNPLPAKSKSDKRMAGALRKLPPLPSAGGGSGAGTSAGGGRPDKVIVFSQWTSMLDLLEIPLKKAKIMCRRLDGTMTVPHRERAIQDFESRPEVMVLLVSLKAAALGVNLTVANHVVLMDLWWNPTTEEQAIDRAHRIGQTRTVHVTRLTIAGSVEDRILELQQAKREVVAAALSEGRDGSSSGGRLTLDDLHFLFNGLSQ